jgi:hypothetical protein
MTLLSLSFINPQYSYFLDEVNWRADLATPLEKYKQTYLDDEEASQINIVRLLPFRTRCNCGKQLSGELVTTTHVI